MLNINWQRTSLAHMTSKLIYNKLLANALLCAELKSVLTVFNFCLLEKGFPGWGSSGGSFNTMNSGYGGSGGRGDHISKNETF